MGLVQMMQDWTLVKKEKAGILDALRQTPPGAAVSVNNPSNPITARALIEILKEFPNDIEIMDYGFSVTLMRKVGMVKSMTADSYQNLRQKHQILSGDSVADLGLDKGHSLPAHAMRDGVPDDINGQG